jgi:S1-C subfamily serine protease
MKRILTTGFLTLVLALPLSAHSWVSVVQKLAPSIVRLETQMHYTCTGFSIGEGYFMTAHHCLNTDNFENEGASDSFPPTMSIVWRNAKIFVAPEIVYDDAALDVTVLHGRLYLPALRPELRTFAGEPVATYGYGYGQEQPFFRHGYVASPSNTLPWGHNLAGQWFVIDTPYIGGMSGGPVVNEKGRVVGLVQMSDRSLSGFGRPLSLLYEATKSFWKYQL